MAVLRWDPWGELAALQQDVNELFGRLTPTAQNRGQSRTAGSVVPPIDAYRTEDALYVHVELAGVRPSDVDISVQEGVLTISGERRAPADVPDESWVRRERPAGLFQRSFTLPEGTNAEEIRASFEDGMLELCIPHPPEQKPHRVQITTGESGQQTVNVSS